MRRVLLAVMPALMLLRCGGDAVAVNATFVLPQAFTSAQIKSFEIFVIPASELHDDGPTTCQKFFDDQLGPIANTTGGYKLSSFDASMGSTSTVDIKVRPGKGYVVLAQGWDVDLVASPDATPKQVIAVGCVPDVTVVGSKVSEFTLGLCVCATPAPGDSSTACKSPTCPPT
jgi:hypothetical protein